MANKHAGESGNSASQAENTELLEKLKSYDIAPETDAETDTFAPVESVAPVREAQLDAMPELSLKSLVVFFLSGQLPETLADRKQPDVLTPALLHPFRGVTHLRYDYPLVVPDVPGEIDPLPLRELLDAAIAAQSAEGDTAERLKRDVLLLEAQIRQLFDSPEASPRLSNAIDAAMQAVLNDNHKPQKNKTLFSENIDKIRQSLKTDGVLVPFDRLAPAKLLLALANRRWRQKSGQLREEVTILINQLTDLIRADDQFSDEFHNAEKLQSAMGKRDSDELDFEALSALIGESSIRATLPEARRRRIENVLNVLQASQNAFWGTKKEPARLTVADTCAKALKAAAAQREKWLTFWKSMRIGRLEILNKYDEAKHHRYFENFTASYLSELELQMEPPLLLTLVADKISDSEKTLLHDLLASGYPVKTLLLIDDLQQKAAAPAFDTWKLSIARIAIQQHSAYVLQSTAANVAALVAGFAAGVDYAGAALFSVFVQNDASDKPFSYLRSAAAAEARAFPVFSFNPAKGETWREQFSLAQTPQAENAWAGGSFEYQSANGEAVPVQSAFTAADFLALDARLSGEFLPLPPSIMAENLLPVTDFIADKHVKSGDKLPFVWLIDDSHRLWKALPTARVVAMSQKIAVAWRMLQEFGGINNSYAQQLLDTEKAKLRESYATEIAELKASHETEMSQKIDQLSREIISRIAAGLLSEGMSAVSLPPVAPAKPAAAPAPKKAGSTASEAAPAPAAEAPADEEEDLSFNDPYIDTPLCTSCNDCINLNNMMFAYDENKQAFIKDATAGTFRELVTAAEKCPVKIIHPGKPKNPNEPGLDDLLKRAARFG